MVFTHATPSGVDERVLMAQLKRCGCSTCVVYMYESVEHLC